MNTDSRYLPVVALDLDGVLRVAEPADPTVVPDGLFSVEFTIRREGYPTYAHREPEWDEQDRWTATHWLSAVGAVWARDLVEQGVTVVWATTWQHAANEYFAGPLGLPELPVAVRGEGRWWADSATWKSQALSRQFDGRPLLWVDDHPRTSPSMALPMLRRRNDRILTAVRWIRTWETGITPADIAEMGEWLRLASAPGGHEELRRRRRRDLDRLRAQYRREEWGTLARYEQWRTIQRRLQAAIGPHQALPSILADHALDHPDLDPTEIADLAREWGDEDTPAVPDLIRIIRDDHQEDP